MTEHKNIADANLHEPKGVVSASANTVYLADGSSSGDWEHQNPRGFILYNDLSGSGTTISTPTSYTLVNAAASSTSLKNFTTNSLGRLTYTGTSQRHLFGQAEIVFQHSLGGGEDIYFHIYKDGSALGSYEAAVNVVNRKFAQAVITFDDLASTNDYYEVYVKSATGNVTVYGFTMSALGVPA